MEINEDASQPMDCDDSGSEKGEKEKKSMGGVERVIFCQDHDYLHQIQDEICLEGLDGITLQALWLRPGFLECRTFCHNADSTPSLSQLGFCWLRTYHFALC